MTVFRPLLTKVGTKTQWWGGGVKVCNVTGSNELYWEFILNYVNTVLSFNERRIVIG